MTPEDIAKARELIAQGRETEDFDWADDNMKDTLDGWTDALDALEHAICAEGDHLSIASRRMVDTVMGERDALKLEVMRMRQALLDAADAIEDIYAGGWASSIAKEARDASNFKFAFMNEAWRTK